MSARLFKRNDTDPLLELILVQDAVTKAVSVYPMPSGTIVVFNMWTKDGHVKVVDRAAATIVNATTGLVSYGWAQGGNTVAGDFLGEFEVTQPGPGGIVKTFPTKAYIPIHFDEDIA